MAGPSAWLVPVWLQTGSGALLVTGPDVLPPATESLLGRCGDPAVETLVLSWRTAVAEPVVARVDELDGRACG